MKNIHLRKKIKTADEMTRDEVLVEQQMESLHEDLKHLFETHNVSIEKITNTNYHLNKWGEEEGEEVEDWYFKFNDIENGVCMYETVEEVIERCVIR